MDEWYPLDDTGDLWGLDDSPRIVVSLSKLEQQKNDLLAIGVKAEPDEETLDFYNQQQGHYQQKLLIDEIDRQIDEINAAKGE